MSKTIFWVVLPIFLAAGLSAEVRAEDQGRRFGPYENEIASYGGIPYCFKTNEQVAFELFLSALKNVQELRNIGTYDKYIQTYEKSLRAVYGEAGTVIRFQAPPAVIEKWKSLSPDRREAISKKLSDLITQSQ